MAPIRSLGNTIASFNNYYGKSGTDASRRGGTFAATGGTEITNGNTKYHVFTTVSTDETFEVTSGSKDVTYLVVAGGGGGGTGTGGGGGAGGVRTGIMNVSSPMPVYVGMGATAKVYSQVALNGVPSNFGPITSTGGGAGASGSPATDPVNNASPGGSGGGGMSYPSGSSPTGGSGNAGGYTPVEGYAGGTATSSYGGGGGGAGGVGANGNPSDGGDALAVPTFPAPIIAPAIPAPVEPTWTSIVGPTGLFGGGGSGVTGSATNPAPGQGGGQAGNNAGTPGVDYTGSGGGANWGYVASYQAGGGGNGIIAIKYDI